MAFPAPVAILRGTCTGTADLLTQLQTYFNGVSTCFALSSGVAYDAGDSLCIEPLADPGPSTDWQINIRRTSTTAFKTQLDPSGTITDAGSTGAGPTGASTMASFEDNWTLQSGVVAVTFFLAEWNDTIMLVTRHSTAAYHWEGCHTGRLYNPAVADIDGLDGLANLCGDVGTEEDRRVLGPKTHAQTRGDVYRVIEPQYNKETMVEFRTLRGAVDEVKSFTRGYYRDPKFLGAQGYAVRYNAGGSNQKVLIQRTDGLTLTDLDWLYLILK